MADHRFDPEALSCLYKYGFQQQQKEPTSVLELFCTSPSPSASDGQASNASSLSLADLDSFLNVDLPQGMDLDAILPSVFEYEESSSDFNCLHNSACEELPPLNNSDWNELLEDYQFQPFPSFIYDRHINLVPSDYKDSYGGSIKFSFSNPREVAEEEKAAISHTEHLPINVESKSSGFSPLFCEMPLLNPDVLVERKIAGRDLAGKQKPYDRSQLLQKLVACAHAVACHDNQQADFILQELQTMISPYGDSLQRVASCFMEGLRVRLGVPTSMFLQQQGLDRDVCEGCPFILFGHFATNSIILDAIQGEEVIHIIDLGMELGLQWPALIQGLAYRGSRRPLLLRITGVGTSFEKMEASRQELEKAAKWLKLPFEFRAVIVQNGLASLRKGMLDLRAGEVVVVNSLLQFHGLLTENKRGLSSVLKLVRDISPKILTIVEQEANHNGPLFLGRFHEALQYYTAIFESLEATMSRCNLKRARIEQCYFGEQIKNVVSCEGPARVERHERLDQWRRRMGRAGFQPFSFKFLSLKARIWLARYDYCDDYTLAEEKGSLVLGWKGKSIMAASAWHCS